MTKTHRPTTCPARLRRRGRTGASVLELAITLLVLLNLTFGTIEFGHFFFVKSTVQAAAREGARVAITPGASNTSVQNAINPVLTAAGLKTGDFTFTVRVNGALADASTAASGDKVEVVVTSTWGTVGLRPLGVISPSKVVLGGVAMRRESN